METRYEELRKRIISALEEVHKLIEPSVTEDSPLSAPFPFVFCQINDTLQMGKYPVTVGQFRRFVEESGYDYKNSAELPGNDMLPVVNVTWWDASAFCAYYGWRLPTDDEWTEAAGEFPGDSIDDYAWTAENTVQVQPVGQKLCNEYGLYDMYGNVWEWTSTERTTGHRARVLRGGSFYYPARYLRSAFRNYSLPDYRITNFGFRAARD